GKTLTVIAYHLHRARPDRAAGPTLVVCPTSLLANWEREFARFAPDVPVRRHHAASRSLDGLAPPQGQVVITTYGTLLRDAGRLVSPFLLRRRKTDPDVAPELPEKVVSDRYVELTREQAALYQAATADTLARIGASTGIARRGQVLRLLQSLRQICNSPAHF